jgi:glycosyltransferase involved in cell wall biosynthesis
MWYAHGTVTDRLHRAHEHATCVITSSPEGFRIPSDKVRVIGQGIDTALFTPPASRPDGATIVAVGRVSRRKSLHAMLDTLAWLRAHAPQYPFTLRLIGPTLTRDDSVYRAELHETIRERGLASCARIEGPRAPDALPAVFASAFLHLNLSRTGSMDKAILESLACGCPTLTSNESVSALLADVPELIVRDTSPEALGRQICEVYERRHTLQAADLRALVAGKHDLDAYVDRVHGILSELAGRTSASQPAAVPPSSRGRHLPIMDAR